MDETAPHIRCLLCKGVESGNITLNYLRVTHAGSVAGGATAKSMGNTSRHDD
jgi:hypothetical protein